MTRLSRIEIAALRGLPADFPAIPVKARGLVVYGPNGSGKSSIVDGIEFALKAETTLFPEKRAGVSWEKASAHLKGGKRSVKLYVNESGSDVLIQGTALPAPVTKWSELARRSQFVLRRHMLLRFVVAVPSARYEQLAPFMNVSEFLAFEAKLDGLATSAKRAAEIAGDKVVREASAIRTAVGLGAAERVSREKVQAVLVSQLQAAGFAVTDHDGSISSHIASIKEELSGFAADSRMTELANLRQLLISLVPVSTYNNMLSRLIAAQQTYSAALALRTEKVAVGLLRHGLELIEQEGVEDCPLCESKIDPSKVAERIRERIAKDDEFISAEKEFRDAIKYVRTNLSLFLRDLKTVREGWSKLIATDQSAPFGDEAALVQQLLEASDSDQPVANLADLVASLRACAPDRVAEVARVEQELATGGGQRRVVLGQILASADVMSKSVDRYEEACRAQKRSSATQALTERVHGHAVQARKAAVQEVIDRVSGLANDYYEFLHPGEGLNRTKLTVREVGSGSLEIETEFAGKREHPLLYLSESHLDTLGLCFFLAARRLEADATPEFKLLVLDDVIHSVDAHHRERFSELLATRFSDHQIVLVTHDSVFFNRLRISLGDKFEYLYITSWSLDAGPVRATTSTDFDRVTDPAVRGKLTADELAAACGRFLEFLLRGLNEALSIPIPARFSREHDIGTLWPNLASKLKTAKNSSPTLKAAAEKVDANIWVRNRIGAHYNAPPVQVSDAEVRQLAEAVAELLPLVHCSDCSTLITRRDSDDWRCKCETLSYRKPSAPSAPLNPTAPPVAGS